MKYKELKTLFNDDLQDLYDEQESSGMFFISLQKLSNYNRIQYFEFQKAAVQPHILEKYLKILSELTKGKPLQYILQEAYFYGLKFKVTPDVLIPRDETEELVDLIIKDAKSGTKFKSLLDVGTGSGCIAIALKSKLSPINVTAMDISAKAIAIAKENAEINGVNIDFILADVFKYVPQQKFDVIVSNPPYIKEEEKISMNINVLEHEPHNALFVSDEDPLIFYKAIAKLALTSLNPGGHLYFEINEHLGKEMLNMAGEFGFQNISLIKDMQQKDRMLYCQL